MMYEGWRVEYTNHVRRRMTERMVDEEDVLQAVRRPDSATKNARHGGRLLSRYLPEWDRMLVVGVEEREAEGVLLVKTVLWLEAK